LCNLDVSNHDFSPWPTADIISGKIFHSHMITGTNDLNRSHPTYFSFPRINRIVLVFGMIGSGKTTTMMNMTSQLHSLGMPCLILDFKNEYVDLMNHHRDILAFTIPGNFKFNILEPYTDLNRLIQKIVDLLEETNPIRSDAILLLQECLRDVHSKTQHLNGSDAPTLFDVQAWFQERIDSKKIIASAKGKYRTLKRVIDNLVFRLGESIDCLTGFDMRQLLSHTCIFRLHRLDSRMQTFVANYILLVVHTILENQGERDRLKIVVIIDECKMLLGAEKFSSRTVGVPFIKMLVTQGRGIGLGFIFGDNDPTSIAPFVKSNASAIVYLAQPNAAAMREAMVVTGAQEKHKKHFQELKVGQGFLKLQEHPSPILVQMPDFPKGKHTTEREINKIMEPKLKTLAYKPRAASQLHIGPLLPVTETLQEPVAPDHSPLLIKPNWGTFLEHVAAHQGANVSTIYSSSGLSYRKAHRLRLELEENGFIIAKKQNNGASNRPPVVIHLTEKAQEYLNEEK
jgi:predicted transcriptional regulator